MTDNPQDPRPRLEQLASELGVEADGKTDDELVQAIEAAQAAAQEQPPDERTIEQLRARAGELEIDGRSKLKDRESLIAAIAAADAKAAGVPQPGTPEQVGRPPLEDVAAQQLAEREERTRHYGTNPNSEE